MLIHLSSLQIVLLAELFPPTRVLSVLNNMSTYAMPTLPYAVLLGTCCILYFVVYPVVVYFRDAKGELQPNTRLDPT